MDKINEAIKIMRSLNKDFREYVILTLLEEETISFPKISELYVLSLERKDDKNRTLITSSAFSLAQLYQEKIPKSQKIFVRCKAAWNMIESRAFYKTPFEKELKALVKKHNYSEDENGVVNENFKE